MFKAMVSEFAVVVRTLSPTQALSDGRPAKTLVVAMIRNAYRARKASSGRAARSISRQSLGVIYGAVCHTLDDE